MGMTNETPGRVWLISGCSSGFSVLGAIEETSAEYLRAMFDVNFFGAVELTQAVLPVLREQGSGTIVVMSSLGGVMTFPGLGGYNATKHALEALGEALSLELTPLGIRVVVVEPGMFRTNFSTSLQWTPENPAYHATSGELRQMVKNVVGQEPNDPAKGAAAIVKVLESENPPLHFLLGEDAVDGLRQHHEALLADVTTWESLSRSTTIS